MQSSKIERKTILLDGKRILFLSSENFAVRFREKKEAASLIRNGASVKFVGVGDSVPTHFSGEPYEVDILHPCEYKYSADCKNRYFRIAQNLFYYPIKRKLLPYAGNFDLHHRWRSKTGKALFKIVKNWNPDIIHCADAPTLGFAANFAKRLGVPFVYDCHEWWQGVREIINVNGDPSYLDMIIEEEKRFASMAALTLTTSEVMTKKMATKLGSKNLVELDNSIPFPNPVFVPAHRPMRFVFHGTLAKNRGIFELIEAFSQISGDAELYLHGNYTDISEATFKEKCTQLGVENKVHFFGPFKYEGIYSFLKNYDVAVWTSKPGNEHYNTTLPNKLFDSVCSGLAVAMPDFQSINAVLERECVGVAIKTDTVEDIRNGLQYLVDNPDVVTTMKANSIKAASKYCWEEQERKLIDAYKELI